MVAQEQGRAERIAQLQLMLQTAENKLPGCSSSTSGASSAKNMNAANFYPKKQQFVCTKQGQRLYSGRFGDGEKNNHEPRAFTRTCLRREEDAAVMETLKLTASGAANEGGEQQTVFGLPSWSPRRGGAGHITTRRKGGLFATGEAGNRNKMETVRSLLGGDEDKMQSTRKLAPPSRPEDIDTTCTKTHFFPATRSQQKTTYNVALDGRSLQFDVTCLTKTSSSLKRYTLVYDLFDNQLKVVIPEYAVKDGLEQVDAFGNFVKKGYYRNGEKNNKLFSPTDFASIGAEFELQGLKFRVEGMCPFASQYLERNPSKSKEVAAGAAQEEVPSAAGAANTTAKPELSATTVFKIPSVASAAAAPVSESTLSQMLKQLITTMQQQDPRKLFRQFDKEKDNVLCFQDFQALLFAYGYRLRAVDASRLFHFFTPAPSTAIKFEEFLKILHRDYAKVDLIELTPFSEEQFLNLKKSVDELQFQKNTRKNLQQMASLVARSSWKHQILQKFRQREKSNVCFVSAAEVCDAFSIATGVGFSVEEVENALCLLYKKEDVEAKISYVRLIADLERVHYG
ncbi:unnamed protein product [Amoebophrya sp. A120]|nr:unnamed protein product [Amoebophrya sp. A120]|eukprot:GSA120T00017240001.1